MSNVLRQVDEKNWICCCIPSAANPSCLHTTLVLLVSQKSSQMVPQVWFTHTSTLPCKGSELPTKRTAPFWQGAIRKKTLLSYVHGKSINDVLELHCVIMLTNTFNTCIIIVIARCNFSRSVKALEKCFFIPWTTKTTSQYRFRTLPKVSIVSYNWSCSEK